MPEGKAVYFAAPMYWVLDVTINVLQTPHRALVADLATEEQQIPMQVCVRRFDVDRELYGFFHHEDLQVPCACLSECRHYGRTKTLIVAYLFVLSFSGQT